MSEEFVCQSCEKIIEPEGDLQPVTVCTDCYYRMSESDNQIDALRKQLEEMTKNADFYQGQYLAVRFENDALKTEIVRISNPPEKVSDNPAPASMYWEG